MLGSARIGRLSRYTGLLGLVALALATSGPQADARGRRSDSGYGIAGGIEPELYAANVFNGIYSPRFAEARALYGSGGVLPCSRPMQGDHRYLTVGSCR